MELGLRNLGRRTRSLLHATVALTRHGRRSLVGSTKFLVKYEGTNNFGRSYQNFAQVNIISDCILWTLTEIFRFVHILPEIRLIQPNICFSWRILTEIILILIYFDDHSIWMGNVEIQILKYNYKCQWDINIRFATVSLDERQCCIDDNDWAMFFKS